MSNAFFFKPLPIAGATASQTAAGYDPANVGIDQLGVGWKASSGQSTRWLMIDLGADTAFDTIAMFGIRSDAAASMQPWQLVVEAATAAQGNGFPVGSWTGTAQQLLAGSTMPVSGRGKSLWMAPAVSPPPPSRYIRLTLQNMGGAGPTVGRVAIGQKIQPARNFQYGAAFGVKDLGGVDFSRRGVLLRTRGEKLRTVGLAFKHVYRDEAEGSVHPLLEQVGNTEPIVLVTDPDAHPQRQNRMYFGTLFGDIGTAWARAGGFECRANLIALDR